MQKHVLWATLTLSALLPLSGCEVDNCEKNTEGCVGGNPVGGKCKFDLVVGKDGKCVAPGNGGGSTGSEDAGKDASADAAPMSECPEGCEEPALCVPDRKECVNFCETPDTFPNSGPFVTQVLCGGEGTDAANALTFAQICANTCELTCRYWNWFCPDAAYNCATECAKPEVLMDCMKLAADMPAGCGDGTEAEQRECQQTKCEEIRNFPCKEEAGICPINPDKPGDTGTPECGNVVCSNDCTGNVFDGYCDDGAFSNGATDFCAWGSDCADCGPRRGEPGPLDTGKFKIGEVCSNSFRCEGNTLGEGSSVVPNEAWCRQIGADGNTRCIQDCSTDGEECPEGFECEKLNPPYEDDKGREGKGCLPKKNCE